MMPQKHLHELLKDDQEPFILTNFIADKRSLLNRPSPKSHFRLSKPKPISDSSDFAGRFCRSACFLSFGDSPDFRKFEFQSPVKSPCRRSPSAVFLHVPARTAGVLLEAALRIQKQSATTRTTTAMARSKTLAKSNGLGLLGSFIKRFTHRGRARKREIDSDCRRNDQRVDSSSPAEMAMNENENDSVSRQSNVTSFDICKSNFCDSPFRFVLQSSSSTGHRTPEFSSPPSSPARLHHDHQVNDVESLNKLPVEDEEEEEEKEQSSPVSVLDPPFEDDDERHYEDEDDDYDLERSYAIVQKTKHQLLKKLRRFERLAELDPVELETFLLEDEEDELDDDIDHLKDEEEYESHNFDLSYNETEQHNIVANGSSSFQSPHRPAKDTKRLICNLITEERDLVAISRREETTKRVYMRSDLWKRVDSNAIDVTVGQDLKAELDGWNRNGEQRGEIAIEIEVAIFSLLVEEMQSELHCLTH